MALWLSEQQKRPNPRGGGQTGIVTMAGDHLTVRLDSEVSIPEIYGPAGYCWTPGTGDRVLVMKGEGEKPCVIGVRQGGIPGSVVIRAGTVDLQGALFVNGVALETYIRDLAKQAAEGSN